MPLYEYQCGSCAQRFEQLVRLSGAYQVACPSCASANVRKAPSTFAAHSAGAEGGPALAGAGGGCCGGARGCACG